MTGPKDAPDRWQIAARAISPEHVLLTCVEIAHPAITEPVRLANDTQQHVVNGDIFYPVRFDPKLDDSVRGRAPQAQLRMDNVGSILTQWIDASQGGHRARARFFQIAVSPGEASGDNVPDWEKTMEVRDMSYDNESAIANLGYGSLLDQPAVQMRHDPETSPGAF